KSHLRPDAGNDARADFFATETVFAQGCVHDIEHHCDPGGFAERPALFSWPIEAKKGSFALDVVRVHRGRARGLLHGCATVEDEAAARAPTFAHIIARGGVDDVGAVEGAQKRLAKGGALGTRERVREEASQAFGEPAPEK